MARRFLADDSESLNAATSTALESVSTAFSFTCWILPDTFDGNGNSGVFLKLLNAFANSYGLRRSASGDRLYNAVINVGGLQATDDSSELSDSVYTGVTGRWTSGSAFDMRFYDTSRTLIETVSTSGTVTGSISHGSGGIAIGEDNFGHWSGRAEHVKFTNTYEAVADLLDELFTEADQTAWVFHTPLDAGDSPEPNVSGEDPTSLSLTGTPEFVDGPDVFTAAAAFPFLAPHLNPAFMARLRARHF